MNTQKNLVLMNKGDYVRTRWGCIAKFEGIHEGFYEFDNIIMDESSAVREELFVDILEKSSPNIIDLIEEGDYVNGYQITSIQGIEKPRYSKRLVFSIIDGGENNICAKVFDDKDIKSIVTHEQFSSMEYKVESEVK